MQHLCKSQEQRSSEFTLQGKSIADALIDENSLKIEGEISESVTGSERQLQLWRMLQTGNLQKICSRKRRGITRRAVTYENGQFSSTLDTETFKIYDVEEGKVVHLSKSTN